MSPQLQSLFGLLVILALTWLLSERHEQIAWRTVGCGLFAQFAIALISLNPSVHETLFHAERYAMTELQNFALQGALIPFGFLARPEAMKTLAEWLNGTMIIDEDRVIGFTDFSYMKEVIFLVSVPASLILVSTLSALLYRWGILQRVVQAMAWLMRKSMRTSGSESFAAVANIFLGQPQSALVIRPYLARMTKSEIMALMTVGMATISGAMVVVYSGWGLQAGDLVTASMMGAPGALVIAKIMLPETQPNQTAETDFVMASRTKKNIFDVACRGAMDGVMLSVNIIASVIAFVALVALANSMFVAVQRWCGIGGPQPTSLEDLLGYVNAPFAWLIGVPWHDCKLVGSLMGKRIVLNEFLAYSSLVKSAGLDRRSFLLATYALCGFANFSSIAIQIGGIGRLAPSRRRYLAELGLRAMIGGILSCYLSAAMVGFIKADY